MIAWLDILGRPRRQLYRHAEALPHLDAQAARHALIDGFDNLRSSVDGETSNVRVNLRNDALQASQLFAADPPIGYEAVIWRVTASGTVAAFRGVVGSVTLGRAGASLELRA